MFFQDPFTRLMRWRLIATSALCMLAACAGKPSLPESPLEHTSPAYITETDEAVQPAAPEAPFPWSYKTFPGKKPTFYTAVHVDGRDSIRSDATSAASMLRQKLRVEPGDLGKIGFSWKIAALIKGADLTQRDTDDSPVRVVLVFDGDRSTFSGKNAMLSELVHAMTGEPLPYATLMYAWDNQLPRDSVVVNPRTDRIRKLVLESGSDQVGRWLDYERDIRADYQKAFGEPAGALIGIGLMTDTDNTREQTQAWYGAITLKNQTLVSPTGKPAQP